MRGPFWEQITWLSPWRRHGLSQVMLMLIAMAGGCATASREAEHHPVWPPPPAPARVVHRENITRPADLGRPGFFNRLGTLVAGETQQVILRPTGVAVEPGKHLFVADQELQGVHIFPIGSGNSQFIHRAGDVYFVSPVDVAYCGDRVYVSDSVLKQVFMFDVKGRYLGPLTQPGEFQRPTGLACDRQAGEVYVVDTLANRVHVFGWQGEYLRSFGKAGNDIGEFNYPTYVHVDHQQRVYVTDSLNFRVQVFNRDAQYLFEIGELGDASGYLAVPKGVAVDQYGHIYVIDSYFSNVQIFDQEGRFLLSIGGPGEETGKFQVPTGLMIDDQNYIYVCDSYNRRIQMFEYVGGPSDEGTTPQP